MTTYSENELNLKTSGLWRKNLRATYALTGDRPLSWWTGKPPLSGLCPGVDSRGIIHSLLPPNLKTCTRREVLAYFDNTWTLTEILFSSLQSEEAFYRPPYHRLRHPLIFYYAHPAVFYVNTLRKAGLIKEPLNSTFEELFAIGVDEMSWDDLSKYQLLLPSIEELLAYRAEVYKQIKMLIETHPSLDHLPVTDASSAWALFMGFEHERIHLETSSVLIRELPLALVRKPPQWPPYYPLQATTINKPEASIDYPLNTFITVPAASVHLGKPHDWPSYGWDNEYGQKLVAVKKFKASQSLISNGEFWLFVSSGAYQEEGYWTKEGWEWRKFRNTAHPTFWVAQEPLNPVPHYQLRLNFEVVPMQWSWPVEVNFHEAKAYCAWRSEKEGAALPYRLLTEAEHSLLRDPVLADRQYNGYVAAYTQADINLSYGSECPVNACQISPRDIYDVFGNVWEWSEDQFAALPGFKPHYLYEDFSVPCFDGKHQSILGGSFMSTGDEASIWARYHFRPHFFQHAGFRLVQSDE